MNASKPDIEVLKKALKNFHLAKNGNGQSKSLQVLVDLEMRRYKEECDEFIGRTPLWEKQDIAVLLDEDVYEKLSEETRLSAEEKLERIGVIFGDYDPERNQVIFRKFVGMDELEKSGGKIERDFSKVDASAAADYIEKNRQGFSAAAAFHTHPIGFAVPSQLDAASLMVKYVNVLGMVAVAKGGKVEVSAYTPYSSTGDESEDGKEVRMRIGYPLLKVGTVRETGKDVFKGSWTLNFIPEGMEWYTEPVKLAPGWSREIPKRATRSRSSNRMEDAQRTDYTLR